MRAKRIAEQLGMPHGTATHRLRKSILFHLLKKLGENYCFKCAELIEIVDELSIEHKKPWEGISTELFWNLDNIAFSHIQCNKPHRWGKGNLNLGKEFGHKKTQQAPDGKAWCSGHRDYVSEELFHSNQRNVNGVASYCKECRKVRLD
jgi:hypothetical protein